MECIEEQTTTTISLEPPKMYKVIFHNDDKTPMDFVMAVLINIFNKDIIEADDLTQQVHNEGSGIAGVYYRETAEHKTKWTINEARHNGFPLRVTYEQE